MIDALIVHVLPWVLSANTITATLLAGNKNRHAWSLSLFNQALWFVWDVGTHSWGFLPMSFALTIVFARNHRRWTRTNNV